VGAWRWAKRGEAARDTLGRGPAWPWQLMGYRWFGGVSAAMFASSMIERSAWSEAR